MRNIFKKLISDFIFPCLVAIIALLFIPDIADGQVNWPGRQLVDKSSIHGQTTKKQSRIRFEERGDVIVAINSHGETIGTYPADHSRAGEKWQNTTSMAKFFTLQDAVNAANDGETLLQILNSFEKV